MGQTVKIKICNLSQHCHIMQNYPEKWGLMWEWSEGAQRNPWAPKLECCESWVNRSFFLVCEQLSLLGAVLQQYISILKQQAATKEPRYISLSHRTAAASLNHQLFQHVEGKRAHGKASWRRRRRLDKNRSSVEKASPDAIFWTVDWEIRTMNNEVHEHWSVNFPCSQAVFLELFNFMGRPASLLVKSFNSRY